MSKESVSHKIVILSISISIVIVVNINYTVYHLFMRKELFSGKQELKDNKYTRYANMPKLADIHSLLQLIPKCEIDTQ